MDAFDKNKMEINDFWLEYENDLYDSFVLVQKKFDFLFVKWKTIKKTEIWCVPKNNKVGYSGEFYFCCYKLKLPWEVAKRANP